MPTYEDFRNALDGGDDGSYPQEVQVESGVPEEAPMEQPTEQPMEQPMEQPVEQPTEQVGQPPMEEQQPDAAQVIQMQTQALQDKDMQLQELAKVLFDTQNQLKDEIYRNAMSDVCPEKPTLTIDGWMNEEEIEAARNKYDEAMESYRMWQFYHQPGVQDMMEQAKYGKREREIRDAIGELEKVDELKGIGDRIERLIPILDNDFFDNDKLDTATKLIIADTLAAGADARTRGNNVTEDQAKGVIDGITPEQLIELINSREDLQNAIESERLNKVKNGQQVPKFGASLGASNPALNNKKVNSTEDFYNLLG